MYKVTFTNWQTGEPDEITGLLFEEAVSLYHCMLGNKCGAVAIVNPPSEMEIFTIAPARAH